LTDELALSETITEVSDQELVARTLQGNEDAFEQIVLRHRTRVFQVASRFFRQRSQVEDIAQDVFLKAYRQLSSFEARGSFEGWLTRIATNTCLNELRSGKRHPVSTLADVTENENAWLERQVPTAVNPSPPSIEDRVIAVDLAEKLLSQMAPEDRLVLTLVDGQELSTREVAEATGWSESKIKVKAFRARKKMRAVLEKLMQRRAKDEQIR
jgi:RNA polymerase sigma-70 factor (ECF subfamily)